MLINDVVWDDKLTPTSSPNRPEFHFYGDLDSILTRFSLDGRKYLWNPVGNYEDLFSIIKNEGISVIKDVLTGLFDIGVMADVGCGEYRFTKTGKVGVKEGDLNKEVIKFFIKDKIRKLNIKQS